MRHVHKLASALAAVLLIAVPFACASSQDESPGLAAGSTGTGTGDPDAGGTGSGGLDFDGSMGSDGNCAPTETCDDGLDNDCNGQVDDNCHCEPGATESCYSGPASTEGVGPCVAGVRSCDSKGEFGTWGPCVGEVIPGPEVCDPGGIDESCDGAVDEGCECVGTDPVPCGAELGECSPGTQQCVGGVLGPCVGAVGPSIELCNDLDDDCDGASTTIW